MHRLARSRGCNGWPMAFACLVALGSGRRRDRRHHQQIDAAHGRRWSTASSSTSGRFRPALAGGPPSGTYRPMRMERKWFSRKYDWSPMPHSIFFYEGYAIHGTNYVSRLGQPGLARLRAPASGQRGGAFCPGAQPRHAQHDHHHFQFGLRGEACAQVVASNERRARAVAGSLRPRTGRDAGPYRRDPVDAGRPRRTGGAIRGENRPRPGLRSEPRAAHSITISPTMPSSACDLPSLSVMPHCRSAVRPAATGTNHHSARVPG